MHDTTPAASDERYYRAPLTRRALAPRYLGSWLLVLVLWVCAQLPLWVSRQVGAGLGWLMYASNAKRRDIARVNLAKCFPEQSDAERNESLQRHFVLSGQAYVDLGLLAFGSERRLRRKVRFQGLAHYLEQIERGRNVILLTPHTVGMNFTGSLLASHHPLVALIKPVADPVMDWLLNGARRRFGCRPFLRAQGIRPVARAIMQRMTFYYLPDEDLGPRHSVFVPFFGVPAATLTTLGRLAGLTGAVVVPCFTRLLPGGQGYEIWFEPPLDNFPCGDEREDAARMNRVLEAGIRRMPAQYMWTFKLFKTRPDGAPSPYAR